MAQNAKGPGSGRPSKRPAILSNDIETLQLALDCYDRITGKNKDYHAHTLTAIARQMGMNKDKLLARIAVFEKAFRNFGQGGHIFLRRSGRNARTELSERAHDLFERLRFWIHLYPAIEGRLFEINVGASLTTIIHLLPGILRRWREGSEQMPPINLTHGKPDELLEKGSRGELDLVVTSLPSTDPEGKHRIVELPMYLICHNEHPLAKAPTFDEKLLMNNTVVYRRARYSPEYPADLLDRIRARRMAVESYEEAFAQVLAGGDVITFACPHVLNAETRSQLEAVEVPGWQDGKIRLGLVRPSKSREWRTKEENAKIDSLQNAIAEQFTQIEQELPPKRPWVLFKGHKFVYYVTRKTRGGRGPENYFWHRSDLWLRVTHDGLIKGEHTIKKPGNGDDKLDLQIMGRMCKQAGPSGDVYHLVWRGTSRSGDEEYAANLVTTDLDSAAYVGEWVGRQTWIDDAEEFMPLQGFMVVTGRECKVTQLNQYVDEHQKKFGKYQWVKPLKLAK